MADLLSYAYTPKVATIKQEQAPFLPVFSSIQNEVDQEDNCVYLGNYSTTTAISGGTITFPTAPVPNAVNKFGTPYAFVTTGIPLTYSNSSPVTRVTATGAASGREWTTAIPLISVSLSDFFGVVFKTSVTSGTVSFRIGSDSSNYYVFTVTLSSASTSYSLYTKAFSAPTSTTGTPVITALDYFAVVGSTAMDIDVYRYATANNASNFIGARSVMVFDALSDMQMENVISRGDIDFFNYTQQSVVTKKGFKITLKQNQIDMKTEAASYGQTIKSGAQNTQLVLNSPTDGPRAVITSNTITVQSGLTQERMLYAIIQTGGTAGVVLNPVRVGGTVADVNETTFFYNTSTGVITFSSVHEGTIPLVMYMTSTGTALYYENKNINTGAVGNLMFQRVFQNGGQEFYSFDVAELSESKRSQKDTNIELETTFMCYPYKVGTNRRLYTYGRI